MAVGTREVVSEAEIPADRRFRIDEERLRRAIAAGLVPQDHGGGDRLSLEQYHGLDDAGLLNTHDRVELLGGWLVAREPINKPHRVATRKVRVALERILPPGWYGDQNAPVTLTLGDSEPEPDVQVTRGEPEGFERHAGPQDVALVVEVADSSLSEDRGYQKRLYALDGVPIYWIVNLQALQIEVYTAPSGPAERPDYASCQIYGPGEEVPIVLDGREIARVAAADFLP